MGVGLQGTCRTINQKRYPKTKHKYGGKEEPKEPELPNTGTGDEFGLFSAAALSILASVGLVASSRKKDDEQEA